MFPNGSPVLTSNGWPNKSITTSSRSKIFLFGGPKTRSYVSLAAVFFHSSNHRYLLFQKAGDYVESFVSKHIHPSEQVVDEEEEDIIKACSTALYIGGADTVSPPSFV